MTDKIEQKLIKIRTRYQKSFSQKMYKIDDLWGNLQNLWNADDLSELHQEAHTIHGTAGVFGFESLSEVASQLERSLSILFEKQPSQKQKNDIEHLILELKEHLKTPSKTTTFIPKEIPVLSLHDEVIYLFQKDAHSMNKAAQELVTFGYSVRTITTEKDLIEIIKQKPPSVLMLDLQLLTSSLNSAFADISEANKHSPFLVFFIGSKNDFSERMKAIRAGGKAYFTKPILIDEVISTFTTLKELKQNRCKVLIVEDEKDIAEYYSILFKKEEMQVKIVYEAKKLDAALSEFKPDLILMDLYMPDTDGIELAAFIRQQQAYESIPIMFLSSEEDEQKQIEALSVGVDDFITKSTKPDILILKIKNKVRRYRILRNLIWKDSLTGIFNHLTIQEILTSELRLASRINSPLSLVIIDLDYFYKINNTYGHLMGDHVLKYFCFFCAKNLRKSDYLGRWGGEEFVIILPNTSGDFAKKVIETLRENFSQFSFSHENQPFTVTFSAGIATYPKNKTPEDIIQAADDALYLAKAQGRNRICMN